MKDDRTNIERDDSWMSRGTNWHLALIAIGLLIVSSTLTEATVVPRGGETLHGGQVVTIQWDAADFDRFVNLDLWDGSIRRWSTIASRVDGRHGTFDWLVPRGVTGNLFRVRVVDLAGGPSEMSGTYFTITPTFSQGSTVSGINPEAVDQAWVEARATPLVSTQSINVIWEPGEAISVGLYDARGGRVRQFAGDLVNQESLDFEVSALPRGVYFVRVLYRARIGVALVVLN